MSHSSKIKSKLCISWFKPDNLRQLHQRAKFIRGRYQISQPITIKFDSFEDDLLDNGDTVDAPLEAVVSEYKLGSVVVDARLK